MNTIYFDNAATTKIKTEVLNEMMPYLTTNYGNASSLYTIGRQSKKAIETARRRVAELLKCEPNEVFFTGGGSESDNIAIKGFAYANIKDPQSPLEQIYLTHNMPLISQLRHNFNLSPEQAKNDPGYQYLVHYFGETNIEDYLDFLQRTIMFFEYDGTLTIGVDKLLTKTRTLDENDQER